MNRVSKTLPALLLSCSILVAQQRKSAPQRAQAAADISVPGDPAHGEAVFKEKGGCLSCHRVGDQGSRLGVNLSDIATKRTLQELQDALTNPPQTVPAQNRLYRVVTRDGATVTGKLLNQSQYSIQMLDTKDHLVGFQKSDVREAGFVETPPMPSYRDKLNADEMKDLLAYLASLKGVKRD